MQKLPDALDNVLVNTSDPDAVFSALLPVLCEVLECDRCFLYLRNPHTNVGHTPYCWRRNPAVPDVTSKELKIEPESLSKEDPLFAAALDAKPSVYVEDVETADPTVVNLEFEQKSFGHRALVHGHLRQDGVTWGILQPCVFGQPRVWTEFDRDVMTQIEQKITPIAVAYVKEEIPE